jgi:hypothetical protein
MENDMNLSPSEVADQLERMGQDAELSGRDKEWLILSQAAALLKEFESTWHTKNFIREIMTWDSTSTTTSR